MSPGIPEPTRRDFLKLSGLGMLGLFVPALPDESFPPGLSGRVTSRTLWVYDRPSFDGGRIKMYWRDLILPITSVTVNEDDTQAYNRIWYEVGTRQYAYSGNIQPVRTLLNVPTLSIPASGALAEVTVPFTDALERPDPASSAGYRIYYETVHWVMSALRSSADGRIWYQILDDKWNVLYYAPGEHLRLLGAEDLTPLSPEVPPESKRIEVHLDDQYLAAYEDERPIFMTRVATGAVLRVGTYYTPRGSFLTYHKRPTRHMAAGDVTASGFDLPGVPWVMYFTESGISLHGTFWHNDFGRPRSHGCVNLTPQAAKWLFRWTLPVVPPGEPYAYKPGTGTQVLIQA
ncbi:MAG: L,D-transpeptidase [Bacteroidota bacterium]